MVDGWLCLQELLLSPTQFGIPNSRLRYYLLAKQRPLLFCFEMSRQVCIVSQHLRESTSCTWQYLWRILRRCMLLEIERWYTVLIAWIIECDHLYNMWYVVVILFCFLAIIHWWIKTVFIATVVICMLRQDCVMNWTGLSLSDGSVLSISLLICCCDAADVWHTLLSAVTLFTLWVSHAVSYSIMVQAFSLVYKRSDLYAFLVFSAFWEVKLFYLHIMHDTMSWHCISSNKHNSS